MPSRTRASDHDVFYIVILRVTWLFFPRSVLDKYPLLPNSSGYPQAVVGVPKFGLMNP